MVFSKKIKTKLTPSYSSSSSSTTTTTTHSTPLSPLSPLSPPSPHPPETGSFQILNTYRNPNPCFTQGLYYDDTSLYISCGLYGKSQLVIGQLTQNTVVRSAGYALPETCFSEGITKIDDKLYALTWKQGQGSVYQINGDNFTFLNHFTYPGEGWGLTHNTSRQLIMSNGTSNLRVFDPETFQLIKTIQVTDRGKAIGELNALAYRDGLIYANIWHSDKIILIDEESGLVKAELDLSSLGKENTEGVLNGITFIGNDLLVTGKGWKNMYKIGLSFFLNLN